MKARYFLMGALAVAVVSALASRGLSREAGVSMHEQDWMDGGVPPRRSYGSLSHAAHHARELTLLSPMMFDIYVLRAISPAFREKVMILTAMSNECGP